MHLGRCPCLTAIFGTINKAVGFVPPQNMTVQQKTLNTLFGHPHKDTPPCIAHVYMIAWRFIITDFYQLQFNSAMPPFGITRAYGGRRGAGPVPPGDPRRRRGDKAELRRRACACCCVPEEKN
jgi:hypothetical protein